MNSSETLGSPPPTSAPSEPVVTPRLELRRVGAGYGSKQVVFDIDIEVAPGRIVVVVGHNGAGKSTTMSAAFGLIAARTGTVLVDGEDATRWSPRERVRAGVAYVPADDFVFADLSVRENLELGGLTERDAAARRTRLDGVYAAWPVLAERGSQLAGTLSGGQRRMLSLGIALMSGPTLLMLDEPSLGLAPNTVDRLFEDLRGLADDTGLSVLLIEQSVAKALAIADDAYVIQAGRVVTHEPADVLARRDSLWDLF